MQSFNIVKTTERKNSFRVEKLIGMFDLHDNHLTQTFQGELNLPEKWNVGVIVGRSGTGKSTIAKELFSIFNTEYSDKAVIDEMPQGKTVEEITKMFTNVGFSSPPSWIKPYSVLSNGEKMRVDLAKALLSDEQTICFDEFTSVVDRDVAKVCSMVINKNVRKVEKQFVAVSCHYDILDFLEPDWIFSTDEMRMIDPNEKKRKPIELKIYQGSVNQWRAFRNYHYMNSQINPAARIFVATLWGKMVGFIGVLHFPHPKARNMKKVTRLVVLPDYQGIGVGKHLLNYVAKHYTTRGFRMTITTSHPALNKSLRPPWRLIRQGRSQGQHTSIVGLNKTMTKDRYTCSWEYI